MSVYDNNGSCFSSCRRDTRRPGALGRGVSDIEKTLRDALTVQTQSTPCNPDAGKDCGFGGLAGGAPSLAMVYCPRQYWRAILTPDEALKRGTLFAELDRPFMGGRER